MLSGITKKYYPSGAVEKLIEYSDDRKQSVVTEYYPDGVIKSESVYRDNTLSIKKTYDMSGKLLSDDEAARSSSIPGSVGDAPAEPIVPIVSPQ